MTVHTDAPSLMTLSSAMEHAQAAWQQLCARRCTPSAYFAHKDSNQEHLERAFEDAALALGCALLTAAHHDLDLSELLSSSPAQEEISESSPPVVPKEMTLKEEGEQAEPPESPEHFELKAPCHGEDPPAQQPHAELAVEEIKDTPDLEPISAPEPAPAASEPSERGVITPSAIEALRQSMTSSAAFERTHIEVDVRVAYAQEHLSQTLSQLGSPGKLDSHSALKCELGKLKVHSDDETLEHWAHYPREAHLALSHMLVARCRSLQSAPHHVEDDLHREVQRIFGQLQAHLKREQAGFVHGMALKHEPKYGTSWSDDIKHWQSQLKSMRDSLVPKRPAKKFNPDRALAKLQQLIDRPASQVAIFELLDQSLRAGLDASDTRLLNLLDPMHEAIKEDARFSEVRRALAKRSASEQLTTPEEVLIDEQWSHWPYVHKGSIFLVGGDSREQTRSKLVQLFQNEDITWLEVAATKGDKHVKRLCKRCKAGSVGLIIVIKSFLSHKAADKIVKACKRYDVPYAFVESGYGQTSITQAIERYLPALSSTGEES